MPKTTLRIHGQGFTQDIPVIGKGPKASRTEAQWALRDGVWVENRLYPPSAIVFIEVIDEK